MPQNVARARRALLPVMTAAVPGVSVGSHQAAADDLSNGAFAFSHKYFGMPNFFSSMSKFIPYSSAGFPARVWVYLQPLVCGSIKLVLDFKPATVSTSALSDAFQFSTFDPSANEVFLLHGTTQHNANHIMKQGFDASLCSRGLYGRGVYFTTDSCKAQQ